MRISTRSAFISTTIASLALVLGAAAPAQAADPTIDPDGLVTIGDAHWQFNEYGVAYGWDAADVYDPAGYIYYPNEFYYDDYLYCGTSGPPDDGTVTVEPNGDLTIVCPAGPWGSSGLTASLAFRVYQGTTNGYLVRQFVTITNATGSPIDITGDLLSYNYQGYTGTQGGPGFYTSLGGDTVAADDTWFVSYKPDGTSVVETEAWARSGSAPAAGIIGTDYPLADFQAASVFAPGETKYFVTFTNMTIPAAQDAFAAADAFDLSVVQTTEFASFSGRLITGLPEGIVVTGWGTTPVTPALANTGTDTQGVVLLLGSTAGILALIGALMIARSRRLRTEGS